MMSVSQIQVQKNIIDQSEFYNAQNFMTQQYQLDKSNEEGVREFAKFQFRLSDQVLVYQYKQVNALDLFAKIGGFI